MQPFRREGQLPDQVMVAQIEQDQMSPSSSDMWKVLLGIEGQHQQHK